MDALRDLPPLLRVSETRVKQGVLQPGLEPTARTLVGISFLQRVLNTHDYQDHVEHRLIVDRVGLNEWKDCTIEEFSSAELLVLVLNEAGVCEKPHGAENGMAGSEIEVFSIPKHRWRCAFCGWGLGRPALVDVLRQGVMEGVSLVNQTWRLVA